MFAVIKTGGKQYKVAKDQILTVERLAGEAGDTVAIESVLMLGEGGSTTFGSPFVAGATVAAEIVEQSRGPKLIVFKKRRRKNSQTKNGHRQDLTRLRVTEILTDGKRPSAKKAAKKPAKAETEAPAEAAPAAEPEAEAEKAPAKKAAAEKAPAKKAAAKKAPAKKAAAKKTAAKKAPAKKAAAKKTAAKKADDES